MALAAEVIDRALSTGQQWLAAEDVARVLVAYGIPVCAQRVVSDVEEAALRAAFVEVSAVAAVDALDDRSTPVLVQPMAPPGIEMIIGAVQRDRFGPVVMVGAGGMLGDLRTGPLLVGYRAVPPWFPEMRCAIWWSGRQPCPTVCLTSLNST